MVLTFFNEWKTITTERMSSHKRGMYNCCHGFLFLWFPKYNGTDSVQTDLVRYGLLLQFIIPSFLLSAASMTRFLCVLYLLNFNLIHRTVTLILYAFAGPTAIMATTNVFARHE